MNLPRKIVFCSNFGNVAIIDVIIKKYGKYKKNRKFFV